MKNILTFPVLLVSMLAMLAFAACSNGTSDDSGSPTTPDPGNNSSTANLPAEYTGSFTVGGNSYVSLSLNNGTYTLSGVGGTEAGTYTSGSRSIADGTYTLTDGTGKTFTVTISGDSITLGGGTKTASGSGGSIYAYETPMLPASSGADPFDGKTITNNQRTVTFSNGTATLDAGYYTAKYKYSWNASKKEFYRYMDSIVLSAEFQGWASFSAEEKNYLTTEFGVAPGKTVSAQNFLRFLNAINANDYKSGAMSKERYLHEVQRDKSSISMAESFSYTITGDSLELKTTIRANASSISDICVSGWNTSLGADFVYEGEYGETWSLGGGSHDRIHVPGMASTDSPRYLCTVYDNGSQLEMVLWQDNGNNSKNAPILGYISATYTGSGSTRTVNITDVSSSAESIAGALKGKSQTLTYKAGTRTYTIKK